MKMKWKIFSGALLWIGLVGIIHYTRICFNKESSNWSESSSDNSIRSYVLSFVFILSYPGQLISSNVELFLGKPFAENFSLFEEICSDIFWALLIMLIIWKFPPKPKKL
jgi:hypothetical protein